MALFKFRKSGDEPQASPPEPESVEAMRRRARHRLIGAAVLVVLGIIGFPLLFDTQPRPIPVDIPIEIPDRNKVKPLAVPPPAAVPNAQASAPVASGTITPASAPAAPKAQAAPVPPAKIAEAPVESKPAAKAEPKAPPKVEPKPEAKVELKPEAKPVAKVEPKPEPKPETKQAAKPDDGLRAQALLEGKPPAPIPDAAERFVVQVGAFADAAKAHETRLKLERSGLKTYTHVAETKEGKRIRVRVGPFATRAEADKAAEKIKGLELPAAILTL